MGDGFAGTTPRWRAHDEGPRSATALLRWAPWLILAMAVLVALPSTPLDGEPSPVVFRAGIETTMIAARAVTMGVDALQGYQLAAPMPAGGIPGLVRQLAISA